MLKRLCRIYVTLTKRYIRISEIANHLFYLDKSTDPLGNKSLQLIIIFANLCLETIGQIVTILVHFVYLRRKEIV